MKSRFIIYIRVMYSRKINDGFRFSKTSRTTESNIDNK